MTPVVQISSLLLFLCVLVLIAGCDNKPPRPKTEASAGASVPRKDADLTDKVKTALGPQAQNLDIDTNAGVVRIRGKVESDEDKQRMQEAAKAVPGVTWVQDQTSVAPGAPAPSAKPEPKK